MAVVAEKINRCRDGVRDWRAFVCAFFALGVITGFSATGRRVALALPGLSAPIAIKSSSRWRPLAKLVANYSAVLRISLSARDRPSRPERFRYRRDSAGDLRNCAIAIVERHDGFYPLLAAAKFTGRSRPPSRAICRS